MCHVHSVQGEEAVQKVLFLDRRAKSKTSANLVASGPAGSYIKVLACAGTLYLGMHII